MDFSLIFSEFLCMVVVGVLLLWWCLSLWWQRWISVVWIFALIFLWVSMHVDGGVGCCSGGASDGFPW